jgi:hypothetical protein
MINTNEADQLGLADAAMANMFKRRDALQKRIDAVEKAVSEAKEQLEESKNDLTSTSLGLFYVMQRVLVELQLFTDAHVDGIHKAILEAVQQHNDAHHAPMMYSDLKMALGSEWGEGAEFSLAVMTAVNDLIQHHLLLRGDVEHDKSLRGNLWTAVTDVRASVDRISTYLQAVRDTVEAAEALGNVTPLWPRGIPSAEL